MSMISMYTDGSCIGNPGPGGWAAIINDGDQKRFIQGGDDNTTNNRMEISAILEGLKVIPEGCSVTVFSDSIYVVNTMVKGWKRKKNLDLWSQQHSEVAKRTVIWKWVKAHAGNTLNEEADFRARTEAYKYTKY